MNVQAYLNFDGRCEEAIEFYKKTLGAEVQMMMRFSENPEPHPTEAGKPDNSNKIMHASFKVGEAELMASDCNCNGKPQFQGISLALTVASEAEAQRVFGLLGDGGQVQMPLTKTFFSPSFGMLADKFGISWMVMAKP